MFAIESARHGARVTLAVRQSSIERALELQREMEREIPGAAARVVTLDSLPQEEARYRWLINATCGDVPEGGRHAIGPVGSAPVRKCV